MASIRSPTLLALQSLRRTRPTGCSFATQAASQGSSGARPKASRLGRRVIYPILLASAVSSLAINLRNSREDLRILQNQHAAQVSVLQDLVKRLQNSERLSREDIQREYARVGIIKRSEDIREDRLQSVSWREMLFGRQRQQQDIDIENKELADIENALRRAEADSSSSIPAKKQEAVTRIAPPKAPSASATSSKPGQPQMII